MSLPLSAYKKMPKRMPLSLGFDRYALYFDGEDDYGEVPNSPSLNPDYITFEVLFKIPKFPDIVQHPFSKPYIDDTYPWHQYSTWYHSNWHDLGASITVNGEEHPLRCYITPKENVWYHLVGVYDGEFRVYLNGELRNRKYIGDPIDKYDTPLWIARWYYKRMNVIIAFIRIYNRALSESEIRYNLLNYHNPIRDGLILWLDFEEGHGDKVYDKSGYGNHGTIYGGAKWIKVRQYELRAEVGL